MSGEALWQPQAIVLGAGDFPTHPIPLSLLKSGRPVVCCDGAAMAYIEHMGKMPFRIVGDGDSLVEQWGEACEKMAYADIPRELSSLGEAAQHLSSHPKCDAVYPLFLRITDQETNDQTKAIRFLLSQGVRRIAILGATGRREDHTLGNISLLSTYHAMGLDVRMYTNHGFFLLSQHGRLALSTAPGKAVSVWNLHARNLSATGLAYPLYDFTQAWQGTLNRATAAQVEILCTGGEVMAFVTY